VSGTITFLRVRSGTHRYGLPLEHLAEVLDAESVFPVPTAQRAMRGLIQVRGRLLPLVHLAALLDDALVPEHAGEVAVLVRAGGRELCVEVDDAETVVSTELLGTRGDPRAAWALGVARDETGLIPVLDVPGLVGRMTDSGGPT
jgi:purine-binding chemotaxis protein CheW